MYKDTLVRNSMIYSNLNNYNIASLLQGPLLLSTECAILGGGMAHCSIGLVALNGKMPNCGGTI